MSNIPTIQMNDMTDSMITLEEAERISGQTRLTIQKKFKQDNIQAIAMLKTGKPGRPARVFNRGDFNAAYGISTSPANLSEQSLPTNNQNNQNRNMAQEAFSSSP